jgi:hypothetical protein
MLSIPKPDLYFAFVIQNDILSHRKTDQGRAHAVFSLTNLKLLEEAETLHSCPLMSLNKYCADIQSAAQRAKDQRRNSGSENALHSVVTGIEDSDSSGLDEYDYTTSGDDDYEPGGEEDGSSDGNLEDDEDLDSKTYEELTPSGGLDEYDYTTSEDDDYEPESEEDGSSDGNLEDDEDLDSKTYEELTPSREYKHKKEGIDVTEGEDTDGTGASDIETGASRRNSKDGKLICYPWAVVEVKRHGASRQDIQNCYDQAANCSSACVALLRGLSEGPAHDYHHPVVALTFIGGNARVFLTYAEPLVVAHSDDDEPIILYVSLIRSSRTRLNEDLESLLTGTFHHTHLANEMYLERATGYTLERAATPTHT